MRLRPGHSFLQTCIDGSYESRMVMLCHPKVKLPVRPDTITFKKYGPDANEGYWSDICKTKKEWKRNDTAQDREAFCNTLRRLNPFDLNLEDDEMPNVIFVPSWGQPVPPSESHARLVPAEAPVQGRCSPKLEFVRIPLGVPVAAERVEPVESEGYRLAVPG